MRTSLPGILITIMAIGFLGACTAAVDGVPAPGGERALSPTSPDGTSPGSISSNTVDHVELLHVLEGHSDRVMHVTFSADSACLASSSEDMTIRVWDVQRGQEIHAFQMTHIDMVDIAFSPRECLLASAEAIWDVESMQELHVLERASRMPAHVAFSPDGSRLAIARIDQAIQLWNVATGEVSSTFEAQADNHTFSITFSPDGSRLAAGGLEGTIRMWDVETGQLAATLSYGDESGIHDVAFSPDGNILASGGTMPSIRLWDVSTGDVLDTLRLPDGLFSLAFSPDGTILASAGGAEQAIVLWDVESGERLRSLPHDDQIMTIAFSPDGTFLASGCYDRQIYVWGISTEP